METQLNMFIIPTDKDMKEQSTYLVSTLHQSLPVSFHVLYQHPHMVSVKSPESPFVSLVEEQSHDLPHFVFYCIHERSLSEVMSDGTESVLYQIDLVHSGLVEPQEVIDWCRCYCNSCVPGGVVQHDRIVLIERKSLYSFVEEVVEVSC